MTFRSGYEYNKCMQPAFGEVALASAVDARRYAIQGDDPIVRT
jgi:hypothetical protein